MIFRSDGLHLGCAGRVKKSAFYAARNKGLNGSRVGHHKKSTPRISCLPPHPLLLSPGAGLNSRPSRVRAWGERGPAVTPDAPVPLSHSQACGMVGQGTHAPSSHGSPMIGVTALVLPITPG